MWCEAERRWLTGYRRFIRSIPSSPRCKLCHSPFGGVGRALPGAHFHPSRKNPAFCRACFELAPVGGREMETGILFADVRGFTRMSEARSPAEVAEMMNPFYRLAADIICAHDGIVDKFVGDAVMALFLPAWSPGAVARMVDAGLALLRRAAEPPLQLALGVGVDLGTAFVGNVGGGEVKDFTALGDVVNTAARLQGSAGVGELLMSDRVHGHTGGGEPLDLDLKGKAAPERAWRLRA